jgi:hypothetical protein
MPGIVSQAIASTVLPYALASEFVECRTWPVVENGPFPDGSYLKRVQGAADRREWKLTRRLTGALYDALIAFWAARKGSHQAFYFYPVQAQHDATGVSATGRFLVRFLGPLSTGHHSGFDSAGFNLIQLQ